MNEKTIPEKLVDLMRAARAAVHGGVPPAVMAWVANEPRDSFSPQPRREISESAARAAATALTISGQLRAAVVFLREVYSFTAQEAVYIVLALDPDINFKPESRAARESIERELLDHHEDSPFPFQVGCPLHPTRPDPDRCPKCGELDVAARCAPQPPCPYCGTREHLDGSPASDRCRERALREDDGPREQDLIDAQIHQDHASEPENDDPMADELELGPGDGA